MIINRLAIQNLALYFYFFSINIESFDPLNLGGGFSMAKLAGICYLLSVLPSYKIVFNFNKIWYFIWPIIGFIAWMTLISLININSYSSRFIDFAVILNIVIFIAIINHARKDTSSLEKALLAFAIGSFVTASLMYFGIGAEEDSSGRKTFFKADLNELGVKLATGFTIAVVMIYQDILNLGKKRFYLLFLLPVILGAVLNTGSRTAIALPFLSMIIFCLLLLLKSDRKFIFFILASIIFPIVLLGGVALALQSEVLASRMSTGSATGSTAMRIFLWVGYADIISENYIFGYGMSGADLAVYKYFGLLESPHNVILEILTYSGVVGLVLYSIFLARVFFSTIKTFLRSTHFMPALLLPSIIAFTLMLQGLSEKACWLVLAYIIGTYLYRDKFIQIK
tara:strand:- start:1287 stop:2474 length:1188 start_codon:yes stop_codon:yes gene_type:complete